MVKKIFAIALMTLVASAVLAQNDDEGGGGTDATNPVGQYPHAPELITERGTALWDQSTNPAGNGTPAQNFEAALDAYDCMTADDFVVPVNVVWSVNTIEFIGTRSQATPVTTASISIYADAGGSPGTVEQTFPNYPVTYNGTALIADFAGGLVIPQGTHWVSVQANIDFTPDGQFFWSNRMAPTGADSHFINPGDGFGGGCTTWTPVPACGVGGGFSDTLFVINGQEGASIPTLGAKGIIALISLLAMGGLWFAVRSRRS